jgi:hypothetical protein
VHLRWRKFEQIVQGNEDGWFDNQVQVIEKQGKRAGKCLIDIVDQHAHYTLRFESSVREIGQEQLGRSPTLRMQSLQTGDKGV